ncbi:chitin synthase export chaperone [Kwoniella sp. CBS 6097]
MSSAFKIGSFDYICEHAAFVVCPLVGTSQGTMPTCYSRNVQLGSQIIFQPATCFVHIAALGMTAIMLFHVRSKYTAVGRKEIVTFFYMYMFVELLAIFLDSAIIPTAHAVYPWFTAVYAGAIGALYWCILINGFVGFQFHEDGTPMSLWFLRISMLVIWGVCFFVSIATFKQFASFSYEKPVGLFVTYLIFPAVCAVIYFVSQLILVVRTLDDRWVIGDLIFMAGFYIAACLLLFAFSVKICDAISHYIDGVFFASMAMLLTVMMIYKYWDSITKEDLEFSVGSKAAVWEVKDPLMNPSADYYTEDDSHSSYRGAGGSLVGGMGGNQYYGNFPAQGGSGYGQQSTYGGQGYGGVGGGVGYGGQQQYGGYH